jgi:hypothetical protein
VWTLAAWGLFASLAPAQEPPAAPQPGAAPPGDSVVVPGRPLYVEGALVLVLFGAALFAVCRSSRRN